MPDLGESTPPSSSTPLSLSLGSNNGYRSLADRYSAEERQQALNDQEQELSVSPWHVKSPMTKHVIRECQSSAKLRRIRSRSFGDFIDAKSDSHTFIPPLRPRSYQEVRDKQYINDDQAQAQASEEGNPIWVSILYGMINATIVLPVLMSFGSIIYRDDAFQPYMPVLIKLTMVSGVVHQLCFSTFSSLPFAVGQVQDAGLIFLSAMAKSIVTYCRQEGYDDEALLATTTVGLACATLILGLGLVCIGKLKLAGYVQMLPTCVVGGYLAYIGWFCGEAGVELMAGDGDITLSVLYDRWMLILPGLVGGFLIYGSVRWLKHIAVLPSAIIFLLLFFYSILKVTDTSVEDATEYGWIRAAEPAPAWYHTWQYLKIDQVVWGALPQLLVSQIGMIFVVALSSSLDVAAIELEMKQPLDYNKELTIVGISNIVSGMTGGYTGSYIFSQTIFTLRAGITSRLAGYTLALCQIVIIVLPFPIEAYLPNAFYGSLLMMISVDLLWEWLFEIKSKVTNAEYVVCLATFGFIQICGVEYGILIGIGIYVLFRCIGVNVGEVSTETDESEEERR